MSIASHFFVATPAEAERNDGYEVGAPERRAVFYRVMDVNLEPLYAILVAAECPEFQPVAMSDDYTTLTFQFPPDFVVALAKLDDGQASNVIEKWQADESVPYDNESDLRDLLLALTRLARLGIDQQLNLYLWNCL
jgi:hypothetical protein